MICQKLRQCEGSWCLFGVLSRRKDRVLDLSRPGLCQPPIGPFHNKASVRTPCDSRGPPGRTGQAGSWEVIVNSNGLALIQGHCGPAIQGQSKAELWLFSSQEPSEGTIRPSSSRLRQTRELSASPIKGKQKSPARVRAGSLRAKVPTSTQPPPPPSLLGCCRTLGGIIR